MLIGFIVVIVMILVIVGLMATGNSGGGTGVNQTKATKVVTEIGTLAQSLSFFKTTTADGSFDGFTHASGYALLDGYDETAAVVSEATFTANLNGDGDATDTDVGKAVISQAVSTVNYHFFVDNATFANATIDDGDLVIVVELTGTDADLNQAIGSTLLSKMNGGNMAVDATTGVTTASTYVQNDVIYIGVK